MGKVPLRPARTSAGVWRRSKGAVMAANLPGFGGLVTPFPRFDFALHFPYGTAISITS